MDKPNELAYNDRAKAAAFDFPTRQVTMNDPTPATPIIVPASPRATVQVRFPHGRILEGPTGTPLEHFVHCAHQPGQPPDVAALIDGRLAELTRAVRHDISVEPLSIVDNDGARIYQRSLAFLLIAAVNELFPSARVLVDHSLTMGGLFCQIEGRPPLTADEVADVEARMRSIVEADEPIVRREVLVAEAMALFDGQHYADKVRLLKFRRKETLPLYTLRGVSDYFFGYMVPSTRYLYQFALRPYPPGVLLCYPRRRAPFQLPEFQDYPKLAAMFRQHLEWMRIMDIEDVGALNEAITHGRMQEAILVNEALHEQRIAEIASDIVRRRGQVRLILIAGPSSSGKTTFAKRLSVQLLAYGIRPFALGMDDYFVDRAHTPRDAQGNFDFEALGALDRPLLNQHLLALMAGQEVHLPRFSFQKGQREPGPTVRLSDDTLILAEGIHGLNPNLLPEVPPERVYRIYVSALTQLNIDDHNRIPTSDTRLLRRIVRDARFRGYTARETVGRWESVRRGETEYIFPYQENADTMFNSALVYELAVLKPFVEPLLLQIEPNGLAYVEARRLLAFLQWVLPFEVDLVPDNSLLREFIGGSSLREFTV